MNGVVGPLAFTVGDAETAASALTLGASSSNPTLVPTSGIAFGGSGANRTVTVTPAAGRTGTATITVTVSDGRLVATDTFVLTVAGGALPPPWASQDIGAPGLAGSASAAGGVFTVNGGGDDIFGTSDDFHFVWQAMTGDGEIRVRVTAVQPTNGYAKAGVMIRESLAANSRHAMMYITPGVGTRFVRRTSTGGASAQNAGPLVKAPYWLRLTRVGNLFQGYTSPNGVNWTSVGSVTMTLPSQVYFGLAVTAYDNTKLNTSTFDNVTATP
jgi:Bacterial Ig domain